MRVTDKDDARHSETNSWMPRQREGIVVTQLLRKSQTAHGRLPEPGISSTQPGSKGQHTRYNFADGANKQNLQSVTYQHCPEKTGSRLPRYNSDERRLGQVDMADISNVPLIVRKHLLKLCDVKSHPSNSNKEQSEC